MKKFFYAVIIVFVVLVGYLFVINSKDKKTDLVLKEVKIDEERAVFFSYLELDKYIKEKSEKESKDNINKIIKNLSNNRFNSIILQVRPFCDAIYKSSYFPISEYVKINGKEPSYDILKFFIEESKKKNIKIYAWINPYRVMDSYSEDTLKNNSFVTGLLESKKAKTVEGGIYLNPGNLDVDELILNGVRELVNNYDLYGVLYDDYFYPKGNIDSDTFEEYKKLGGDFSLKEYRFNNILNLIKDSYNIVKTSNKDILFGISPEGNIDNNYEDDYLDIKEILKSKGYIDFVMPQIYYGYQNSTKSYLNTLNEWSELIQTDIDLIPALAFYKTGTLDIYAKEGKNEWVNNNDIIKRQVTDLRKNNKTTGFSLYRYDYVFKDNNLEFNNLLEVLN